MADSGREAGRAAIDRDRENERGAERVKVRSDSILAQQANFETSEEGS
jgi:hypothetical protein